MDIQELRIVGYWARQERLGVVGSNTAPSSEYTFSNRLQVKNEPPRPIESPFFFQREKKKKYSPQCRAAIPRCSETNTQSIRTFATTRAKKEDPTGASFLSF